MQAKRAHHGTVCSDRLLLTAAKKNCPPGRQQEIHSVHLCSEKSGQSGNAEDASEAAFDGCVTDNLSSVMAELLTDNTTSPRHAAAELGNTEYRPENNTGLCH